MIGAMKEKIIEAISESMKAKEEADILFFSPPFWDVYAPFSAVPCLAAKLKEEGYKVKQIDLGIRCIWHVVSKNWRWAMEKCMSESFYKERVEIYVGNPYKTYEQFKNGMWFFHGEDFDISEVRAKYLEMDTVQRGVLEAFYSRLYEKESTFVDFNKCDDISQEIEKNVPLSFWETICSEEILQELSKLPKVVGISITSTQQFLTGCALAEIIKEGRPDVTVIFGGSCADMFAKSNYVCKSDIRKYFDYIIVGEGETALTQLMEYLKNSQNRQEIEKIPNLMLINGSEIHYTEQIIEDVSKLPLPDYDGLNLNLYLTPGPVLPYQASRGCHYGMCAFCNHDEKYRHNYRSKSAKKVVKELIELSQKYKTNYFQFVDEAIRPDCFKEIVEEMGKHPECKNMKWFCYSRVSHEYNEEILHKAKENGCELVMFGVETFNQRLLNFIKKGITVETSKYCIELFHDCGIKTYSWLMCNLPSETMEEVQQDYDELLAEMEKMDGFTIGLFSLVPNTDMWNNLSEYNIISIDENDSTGFKSHNNGVEIDSAEMHRFYRDKCLLLRNSWNFTGSRYALFFQ